ncbi:MAG: hypothetical protein VW576_02525 [Opitutae bacterium]
MPGCSQEEEVTTEKLEYRKDENGILRLYLAGEKDPVGHWKFARVTEKYSNGQKKFEIGFVDGLRHGSFFFWQSNGLKKLTGSFERGKREGTFISYGKAGEVLYQKNYFQDELEGNLSLYYSLTNAEVFRYFEKIREEGLDVGEIPVNSNIRLEATFSKGIPVGPYRTYFHPRGQTGLSKEDLLEEEGRFDEMGRLIGNQVCYYPRTEGLIVYLPDDKPLETVHEPNAYGLSKAIDECYLAISEIPSYRNPKNLPAKVFCVDQRGGKIAPVWSSEIVELAVRDIEGKILPERFDPNFESYRDSALIKAKDVALSSDLANDSLKQGISGKFPTVEIIALNEKGEIKDILWSSFSRKDSLDLEQRILQKRKRIHRFWEAGDATASEWSISSGLNLIIREDPQDPFKDPSIFMPNLQ